MLVLFGNKEQKISITYRQGFPLINKIRAHIVGRIRHGLQTTRRVIYVADIKLETATETKDLPRFTFGEIETGLFQTESIFSEKNRRQFFPDRARQGHLCYGFYAEDGSVASYLWITAACTNALSTPFALPGLRLLIKPGRALLWDAFTSPAYEARGLHKQGLVNAMSICSSLGIREAYATSTPDNVASKYGILAAGFRETSTVNVIRIGTSCVIKASDKPYRLVRTSQAIDIIADLPSDVEPSSRDAPESGGRF